MAKEMPSMKRWLLSTFILVLCVTLLVHVFGMEAFVVPTGSMAPALAGNHREGVCPRCGLAVLVGRQPGDADGKGGVECYRRAACPNCGYAPLPLGQIPETGGDHILVNKTAFLFRRPRRWEIVVFRLFGKVFVKRIIGLPCEWLLIEDGDILIDGELARKSLEEFKAVRILVFDNQFQPANQGWTRRWEYNIGRAEGGGQRAEEKPPSAIILPPSALKKAKGLYLEALYSPESYHWLTYKNFSLPVGKVEPIRDEYAYNGGSPQGEEAVHDFMVECDLEILEGEGYVALALSDGQDVLVAEIPAGRRAPERRASERKPDVDLTLRQGKRGTLPPDLGPCLARGRHRLVPGRTHHLEMAFVDRRLSLTVDGEEALSSLDLRPVKNRPAVERPLALGSRGVNVVFRHVRLYRDIHYTQAGRHAVAGQVVRMGADQYFVLGDNSPNSEDSRFWPNQGRVPESNLLGKPFLAHWSARPGRYAGPYWQFPLLDWSRLRWLR